MKNLLILLIVLLTLSCSRSPDNESRDLTPPVISITTPANNQVIASGQVINIAGIITDNYTIAEVHIHVTNNENGIKYLDVHLYPGIDSLNFNNSSLTALANTQYKIQVLATDRSANQSGNFVIISSN